MNSKLVRVFEFERGEEKYAVNVRYERQGWTIDFLHTPSSAPWERSTHKLQALTPPLPLAGEGKNAGVTNQHAVFVQLNQTKENELNLQLGAQNVTGSVVQHGDYFHVFYQGQHAELRYLDPFLAAQSNDTVATSKSAPIAPMPGKIIALRVTLGQSVQAGDALVVMEAMKMEHTITATRHGVVKELMVQVGDQIADGAPLLTFE
jgi:acetyl/propionyl-CoA carboxylase alpha subunit